MPSMAESANGWRRRYVIRNLWKSFRIVKQDKAFLIYLGILLGILVLGVLGPLVAPYSPVESHYTEDGQIKFDHPPSLYHPLGTDNTGRDVFSRILIGARPTVITGLLGGTLIIGIGMSVGVTAGFFGGNVDNALMRLTDIVYGVPLIPFALVLISIIGIGFINSVIVIGLVLWRGNARVLRSQVLQIKERPFMMAARATGASPRRLIINHIMPNIAGMVVLFFAVGVGYSILIQAGLAFLGVTDPTIPSWGVMVRNAFQSGRMSTSWWWSIPPGMLISLTVLSTFMVGRKYEEMSLAQDQGEGEIFAA